MNSMDFVSKDNNRAAAIEVLQAFCHKHGFDYSYNDTLFTVKLPPIEPVPLTRPTRTRNDPSLDFLKADPNGYHEDELPPTDKPLQEGESPEET